MSITNSTTLRRGKNKERLAGQSTMRDRFHWARLLAFVTGPVNQELLLRNEHLITETAFSKASC